MESQQNNTSLLEQMDLYSVLRDVLRNLWVIVLGAVAVGLIVNYVARTEFKNTYSTTATFVVTSKTGSNYTYNNLQAASTTAETYSNILRSNLLKKKVCQDLGVDSFDATMSVDVVKDTNLITLHITADTPRNVYQITRSVMRNISNLTGYVSSNMVLQVLQEPEVPTGPDMHYTGRRRALQAMGLAGLALAAAFAYLSYQKQTIRSEKELENLLEARSLGALYHDGTPAQVLNGALKRKKYKRLITELAARFEFVERYKKVSAMISTQAQKNGAKVILVTSVREHEGKSTVSANLALSLAQQSHQVLLIDGDMRRPTLNSLFLEEGEELKATLGNLLLGKVNLTEALRYDEKRGLYLLLNEQNYANSTDIVSSENMARLLEVVRKAFDYIIIDSPPMSLMADAEVLADRSDMSILVVKYDLVQAPDLNDAIDALRDCKAHFAGCILNDIRTLPGDRRVVVGSGGYGHYSYYGRYGRYGKYGKYGRYGNYGAYGSSGGYGHYAQDGKVESPKNEEQI